MGLQRRTFVASASLLSCSSANEHGVAGRGDEAARSAQKGKAQMERPERRDGKENPGGGVQACMSE
jgi:hypothetical protein